VISAIGVIIDAEGFQGPNAYLMPYLRATEPEACKAQNLEARRPAPRPADRLAAEAEQGAGGARPNLRGNCSPTFPVLVPPHALLRQPSACSGEHGFVLTAPDPRRPSLGGALPALPPAASPVGPPARRP